MTSGKVRYIALLELLRLALNEVAFRIGRYGWSRYVAQQVYYSLLNREFEWELMPLGIDQKVGAIIWSPYPPDVWAGSTAGITRSRRTGVSRGGSPIPDEGYFLRTPCTTSWRYWNR